MSHCLIIRAQIDRGILKAFLKDLGNTIILVFMVISVIYFLSDLFLFSIYKTLMSNITFSVLYLWNSNIYYNPFSSLYIKLWFLMLPFLFSIHDTLISNIRSLKTNKISILFRYLGSSLGIEDLTLKDYIFLHDVMVKAVQCKVHNKIDR